jgi:hypothetical protein
MRKHLTYANVAATLALVFAMTGGAIAAQHYLINSTKQINPKVLKKLRGARGPHGPTGPKGASGAAGAPGAAGGRGEAGPQGPSGAIAVASFEPGLGAPNTTGAPAFLGTPATVQLADARSAAFVTGTVDLGSTNGKFIEIVLGVCYERSGAGELTAVAHVEPTYATTAIEEYVAQSVSGFVSGVAPGTYQVGLCTWNESPNAHHGIGSGTVLSLETR